jgi:GLPGLI family protein
MKNNLSRGFILIGLLLLSIGVAASQGLYWEQTTAIKVGNGKEIQSASFYRTHMFKQQSENAATIFRLDKEKIYHLDNAKKEYSEMTFAEFEASMKKMSSEVDGKMAEMKKQFEKMPPEQRKMMEKMMGSQMTGSDSKTKITAIKTSEKKTISGYACIKYSLKEDGKEIGAVWTTTGVPDYGSMQKDMKEYSRRMTEQMPMKGGQIAAAMMNVEGFPIQSTFSGVTTTVTKVEKKSIAANEFEIPDGYKKVNPKELMGDK